MKIETLSPKQMEAIEESTAWLNLWEGAVRSGKTFSKLVRWIEFVRNAPPGRLAVCGNTQETAKKNLLEELQKIIGRRHLKIKYDHAIMFNRILELYGAHNKESRKRIQGATFVGALGDEVPLWDRSFFKVLIERLSEPYSKFFGTANPEGPYHWLKTDYLDNEELLVNGDLKSFHFLLDDNPALTNVYKRRIKAAHSGVFYQRNILGLWVLAEGVIYDMFHEDEHTLAPEDIPPCQRYFVAVDYGTSNPCVFLLIGQRGEQYYVLKERYYDGRKNKQKTDSEHADDLEDFVDGIHYVGIDVDPSAASFIAECRKRGMRVWGADNDVVDGIRKTGSLIKQRRLLVSKLCRNTLREFGSYVWDPKAQERGEDKPLKEHDHCMDALRYFVNRITSNKQAKALGSSRT